MPRQDDYRQQLKADLDGLIEALDDLPELEKHFLRSRWLDQVLWMEGRADHARNWYYRLRLTTIVGGVIVPALVSLNISGAIASVFGWITFGLSLLVALSAAVEEFFHYGERWRHYRQTVEALKNEGWQFFQLSGSYRRYEDHATAYRTFAARVEDINRTDVEAYITNVVREKQQGEEQNPRNAAGKA